MLNINLILILVIMNTSLYAQKTLSKWQKAIINIECHQQFSKSVWEDIANNTITYEAAFNKYPVLKYSGTAIFLKHENGHYLITAKHVVFDTSKKDIFDKIILIPSVDNYSEYIKSPPLLSHLTAGGNQTYQFSENLDLAIINLDFPGKGALFTPKLYRLGYEPISLDDISFEDSVNIGDDIICLGFPAVTSIKKYFPSNNIIRQWQVNYTTLPVVSFGKIAQYHKDFNMFLGDISIYPGNSGGPVLHDNKLIGIVSAQPSIPVESTDEKYSGSIHVRIPFGYFEKASGLKQLFIQIKQKRDAFYNSTLNRSNQSIDETKKDN